MSTENSTTAMGLAAIAATELDAIIATATSEQTGAQQISGIRAHHISRAYTLSATQAAATGSAFSDRLMTDVLDEINSRCDAARSALAARMSGHAPG